MTNNQLTYWANREVENNNRIVREETKRSNLARESETKRHNLEIERLTGMSNLAAQMQAQASLVNANTNLKSQEETKRSNLVKESQASANLGEVMRSNLANEQLTAIRNNQNFALGMSTLAETIRHNQQQESISRSEKSILSDRVENEEFTAHAKYELEKIANSNKSDENKIRDYEAVTDRLRYQLEERKTPSNIVNNVLSAIGSFARGLMPFIK